MKGRVSLLVFLVMTLVFSACSPLPKTSVSSSVESYPTMEDQGMEGYVPPENSSSKVPMGNIPAPIPDEGKASLSGVLYQKSHSAVLAKFSLYLTPAQGENHDQPPPILAGPLTDKGDISTISNEKGEFSFNNLEPGNYFLVVSLGYDYEIAVKSLEDTTPLLIHLEPNQQISLGTVIIP